MTAWNNKTFWNDRYSHYPAHGSGAGSRGSAAWYKNKLVKEIIVEHNIRSIIDIGCGDLCWLDDEILAGRYYVGFDISDVAVQQARDRFPALRFDVHDITQSQLNLVADLIVNFDVLIHQLDRSQFDAALANTFAAIGVIGLVSYLTPPLPDGSMPSPVVDNDPLAQQQEAAWLEQPTSPQKGSTTFHETLPAAAALIRPDIEIETKGRYRYQTVYAARSRSATRA